MRGWIFLALVLTGVVARPAGASAQLAVRVESERDTLLLYEAIPVTVKIRNMSARTVQLQDSAEGPWLDFIVADEAGGLIAAVQRLDTSEPLLVPAGQTVGRTVNLLPLYDLRARGSYRVQALVGYGGARVISPPLKFTIVHGRAIWRQTAGIAADDDAGMDEYRTYSLLTRRGERYDILYVGVENEPPTLVYGMLPLGKYLAMGEPEALIDREGHLHVLYRSGPRSFDYARVDPHAKILERAAYSDFMSRPRLVLSAEGKVFLQGGEQTYPRVERVMTEEELAPPAPPPPPRKKWWWPFARTPTAPDTGRTNAPSKNFGPR